MFGRPNLPGPNAPALCVPTCHVPSLVLENHQKLGVVIYTNVFNHNLKQLKSMFTHVNNHTPQNFLVKLNSWAIVIKRGYIQILILMNSWLTELKSW